MSDPHRYQAAVATRPWTVVVAAVMTWLGAAVMLLSGLMFLLGTGDGTFLGQPAQRLGLAGASIPIELGGVIGGVLTAIGAALVILAILAIRGGNAGRLALTALGVLSVSVQVHSAVTGDPVSALVPLPWIGIAVVLLWAGRRTNAWFRRRSGVTP